MFFPVSRTAILVLASWAAAFCVHAQDVQSPTAAGKPALNELKGLPPRTAPGEYQAQTQAGALTIAAEFVGHSVPTPETIYSSEDYVVVEVGLFGPAAAKVSLGDFSLRINGNKKVLSAQPYELTFKSLKDPEWEPPQAEKSKSSLSTGGGGGGDSTPPAPVHMPIELRRPMEQRVQRAAMLEGERPLPRAGLVFFEYRGKVKGIRSIELIYSGAAGNATLELKP
jgi:hypothetical protein